jgi:hypothetical protein
MHDGFVVPTGLSVITSKGDAGLPVVGVGCDFELQF